MGIFEKIISSTKAVNIIQPRFEKISAMQWIEATLDIAVQKGNDPILSNAVEILSRTVEATALGGAHLDFLFGKFADSLNMIAKERLETIFVLLKSSCLNSESIDSPDHTLTSQQFQVCLNIIHVLAIKSSGRCVVLPTLVDLLDRSNLKAVKERALNLVGDFADILWGPKSLLFGNDEETPKVVTDGINCNQSSRPGKSSLEACVTTTNRVMVLELMVESMFYFIVSAKNCPDKNEVRDSFLESIPWQRLFELLWMKYKNASIYQSLLYKLIYMWLEFRVA
ncbi:hypothetical protein BDR26DRAFT_202818 [Obelidium mucronatum]|nr:hypothetical protein BDR26DRAFT_202818 [Obelidium mucronatum]